MTDEKAKAVQEGSKAIGGLNETAQKVGRFLMKIIGDAAGQVGGVLTDEIKFFRHKNILRIADKVEAIHAKRRLEGKSNPIHLKLALPIIQFAELEDDETLQGIWSRLIANATDPNFKEAIHPGYAEVLKQMSSDEATLLIAFQKIDGFPKLFETDIPKRYERKVALAERLSPPEPLYAGLYEECLEFCQNLPLKNMQAIRAYIDNLERLKIIEHGFDFSSHDGIGAVFGKARSMTYRGEAPPQILIPGRNEYMRATSFGESLFRACIQENPIVNMDESTISKKTQPV